MGGPGLTLPRGQPAITRAAIFSMGWPFCQAALQGWSCHFIAGVSDTGLFSLQRLMAGRERLSSFILLWQAAKDPFRCANTPPRVTKGKHNTKLLLSKRSCPQVLANNRSTRDFRIHRNSSMKVHALRNYFHRTVNSKHYDFLHNSAMQQKQVSYAHTHSREGCCLPGSKISLAEGIKLTCFLLLAPTCYPALVATADFVRKRRHADGLDDVAHCVWPWLAQLQQRNVVVVVPAVVIFVDYDPSHCRYKLCAALRLHTQVSAPCSGISQPGWKKTNKPCLQKVPQNTPRQQGR